MVSQFSWHHFLDRGSKMKALKMVVIGGGSSYTPELMDGLILKRDTLPVGEVILVDINEGLEKLRTNTDLIQRMFEKEKMKTKVTHTLERKKALKNADFIMTQFRVGGLAARSKDEAIPIKYNMIGQETTGMGGFFKALRTIPVMLEICKDIEEICPKAWLINFTNPSGIITEAVMNHTHVKTIGLCNVPINMHHEAAEKLGVSPELITANFIGLNHLSYMNACYYKGEDVLKKILAQKKTKKTMQNISKIEAFDSVAKRLGFMLSPYLQYFYFETDMLEEEKNNIIQGKGTRAEQVIEVEKKLFELYKDPNVSEKPKELSQRGGSRYSEAAINLIDSIYNDRGDIQVVNTLNHGSIEDLPFNAAVEINCTITKSGPKPIFNGYLPKSIAPLIKMVKTYEEYTIEAALSGDRDQCFYALLNNPLVHNMSDALLALDEMIEVHKEYLPQFK